ncbi:hypothetical protein ACFXBB_34500 [Streptomyces scopuliridis]
MKRATGAGLRTRAAPKVVIELSGPPGMSLAFQEQTAWRDTRIGSPPR